MRKSPELYFATTNSNKFNEVKTILSYYDIEVKMAKVDLLEIQSDNLEKIAMEKAKDACRRLNANVIVEDDGLFIKSLNGFPGPYSSFVFRTIGNLGIIQLMKAYDNSTATFRSVIAYIEPKKLKLIFVANVNGKISTEIRGTGWGYDPIFIPNDSGGRTYAELADAKNDISHRKLALEKLMQWMKNYEH